MAEMGRGALWRLSGPRGLMMLDLEGMSRSEQTRNWLSYRDQRDASVLLLVLMTRNDI